MPVAFTHPIKYIVAQKYLGLTPEQVDAYEAAYGPIAQMTMGGNDSGLTLGQVMDNEMGQYTGQDAAYNMRDLAAGGAYGAPIASAYGATPGGNSPIGSPVFGALPPQAAWTASTSQAAPAPMAMQAPQGAGVPTTAVGQPRFANGGGYSIPLRGPNGETVSSNDVGEVHAYLQAGYVPLRSDGTDAGVEEFSGGYLIDGLPINTVIGYSIDPAQVQALKDAGKWNADWDVIPVAPLTTSGGASGGGSGGSTGGGAPGGGTPSGGPLAPPLDRVTGQPTFPQIPDFTSGNMDARGILSQLLQYGLQRGQSSDQLAAMALGILPATQDLTQRALDQSAFFGDQFSNNAIQRDALIQKLFTEGGGVLGALRGYMDRANTEEGLSPEALAALRAEATSGIPQRFEAGMEQLRTELARRGALGGSLPGSAGDLLRAMGPLYAEREALRAQAERVPILANEQALRESRNMNRQMGLSATGQAGNLMGMFGQIYNPTPYMQGSLAGLQTALQGTGASLSGIGQANQAMQAGTSAYGMTPGIAASIADMEAPSSGSTLRNSLLSALSGTVLQGLMRGGNSSASPWSWGGGGGFGGAGTPPFWGGGTGINSYYGTPFWGGGYGLGAGRSSDWFGPWYEE